MTDSLMDILSYLSEKQVIRQLDYQFAMFITRQCQQEKSEVAWLCALVSYELGRGHICIPVCDEIYAANNRMCFGLSHEESARFRHRVEAIDWAGVIARCPLVGSAQDNCPLVYDGDYLYLHRYWYYESGLAGRLRQLSAPVATEPEDIALLKTLLGQLFEPSESVLWQRLSGAQTEAEKKQLLCDVWNIVSVDEVRWEEVGTVLAQAEHINDLAPLKTLIPDSVCLNWQKVAAATALTRRFTVISGGPGTGKTTTVARLLAALVAQAENKQSGPLIRLVAPTGKAAARLAESIGKAIEKLPVSPEIKAALPVQASTLHRLLGVVPGSSEFIHHERNPLHVDILVVDEASMVDLPMMYKLLMALPGHARVILLGDKDQLASVEAGAVFGDICSFNSYGFSQEQGRILAQLTGYRLPADKIHPSTPDIADGLCMLQKSYRFQADSGIGLLARLVNSGDADGLRQISAQDYQDIQIQPLESSNYSQMLTLLVDEYRVYLEEIARRTAGDQEDSETVAKYALNAFNRCRLLCALRDGDFGVSGLNQRVESLLQRRGLIQKDQESWYSGRPVMVTQNDHYLGIYNGDIGICLKTTESGREVFKVYFEQFDGTVRGFIPSRLPEHETAYAMTIHKSQGSEFDFTMMILPPDFSPILTRELIYTGITRAKCKLRIYSDFTVLRRAIQTRTKRMSGLTGRLV